MPISYNDHDIRLLRSFTLEYVDQYSLNTAFYQWKADWLTVLKERERRGLLSEPIFMNMLCDVRSVIEELEEREKAVDTGTPTRQTDIVFVEEGNDQN